MMNETQKVQRVMHLIPVTDEFSFSIMYISRLAGVREGITKKTLHTANCMEVKRTGGPRAFRAEPDPKTVRKLFDAVIEPWQEGDVPIKCRSCRFANTGLMQTAMRNKDTVSGCHILEIRKQELAQEE
jgi:hypothetical protein